MRPHIAPIAFVATLLLVASTAVAGPLRPPSVPITAGLQSLEAGAPVPIANRPHLARNVLAERFMGRAQSAGAVTYREPSEFGVSFEYDGSRTELLAAGIRVQSQAGRLFTARVRRDEIGALRSVPGIRNARLARYYQPLLNVSIPDVRADLEHNATGTPPVYNGRAGAGILIGDVDTGIDFTSTDFADASGKTRILYIWDQNDTGGPNPSGFSYGTEWTKANIDNTPGSVRESDTDGHGTNVAGVLVGNGSSTGCSKAAYRYVGMAPQANFIEVATDYSDAGILDGINYIFQKAAALGMDCVVNLSLGSQFSPHDGSDPFGTAIGALTGPGRVVVASAGNDGGAAAHGKLITTSQTVGTDKFTFSVPLYTIAYPSNFNDLVLITGWYDPTASLTLRIKGPNASDTLSVAFGNARDKNLTVTGGKGGKLWVANQNATTGVSGTATLRQFEVEIYDSLATSPPRPGTWEIDPVANDPASIGARVDIWIYYSSVGTNMLTASVVTGLDNTTLVASPACADSIIAVGAHATKASWPSCSAGGTCTYNTPPTLGAIASFSSVGPRRDGVIKPELTAPGFGVATTHSSAVAFGTCGDADDGVHEVTQGTSFSAPHVAGAAALFMQYAPGSSPSRIRQSFEAHARADAFTGAVPNATWGYGKLDVYSTIDHVAPTCTVTSPVGGESWAEGSPHAVTWTAADNVAVTTVDVAYSLNGAGGPWVAIATGVANSGSQSWTAPASVSDSALVRVTAHDQGGNATAAQSPAFFHVVASTGVPAQGPAAFFLATPVPNPSNRSVTLRFSLARSGNARLQVFGLAGQRVWETSFAALGAGEHSLTWDGGTTAGARAATGLYFVRLTTADGVRTARLVRLD